MFSVLVSLQPLHFELIKMHIVSVTTILLKYPSFVCLLWLFAGRSHWWLHWVLLSVALVYRSPLVGLDRLFVVIERRNRLDIYTHIYLVYGTHESCYVLYKYIYVYMHSLHMALVIDDMYLYICIQNTWHICYMV